MLRVRHPQGWALIEHRDHARLAGELASHWGNAEFQPPDYLSEVLVAVERHDDAWGPRDAVPGLNRRGEPSAFSEELVGTYSAFEDINLVDYLAVRGAATEVLAGTFPYAAILVSMHTVNLLTEQADLSKLNGDDLAAHSQFLERQRSRQCELAGAFCARGGDPALVRPAVLQRAFAFLQVCDHLSLIACVGYRRPTELRHHHPRRSGELVRLHCAAESERSYRISPYPFTHDAIDLQVPCRLVSAQACTCADTFQSAYRRAKQTTLAITIVR